MSASTHYFPRGNNKVSFCKPYFRRSGRSCLLILGCLCGGLLLIAAVVIGLWWLTWPKYTVTASLRIAASEPFVLSINTKKFAPDEFEIYKNTQMSIMTNPLVLNAALRREVEVGEEKFVVGLLPELAEEADPMGWLTKKLSISFPHQDEIMEVSMTTNNPVHSVAIVNAVVKAYLAEVVDAERREREKRISELRGMQIGKAQEVKDALNDLRKMAPNLGTSETETLNLKQQNTLAELANYRSELIRTQFDLNRMNSDIASLAAMREVVENSSISDIECELFASSDFILKMLKEEIYALNIPPDPKIKASVQAPRFLGGYDLDRLKNEYSQRIKQIRDEVHRKSKADIEKDIKKCQAQIDVAKKQYEVTQEEVNRLRKEADGFFGMSLIDMQMRRASIAISQKFLNEITAELEKLQVESHASPRITVLQEAEVSKIPGFQTNK
jgi:polysaccharide biosynthesis transport protein